MRLGIKGILQNVSCVVVALILTYFLSEPVQNFYCSNIGRCTGGFFGFDLSIVLWVSITYTFFVTFVLTGFGDRLRYWWITILLIPLFLVISWMIYSRLDNAAILLYWTIYILAGFGAGLFVRKILQKLAPGFMSKIS